MGSKKPTETKKSFPSYGIQVIENGFIVSQQGGITYCAHLRDAFALISDEVNRWVELGKKRP